MKRLGAVLALSIAALAIGTAACGASGSKPKAQSDQQAKTQPPALSDAVLTQWFNEADTNHDGRIDASEKTAVIQSDYTAMDVNKDGRVTIEDIIADVEKQTPHKPVTGDLASYLPMDANHDGQITLEEYTAYVDTRFGGIDANHDGLTTMAEGKAFYQKPRGRSTTTTSGATTTSKAAALPLGASLVLSVPFLLIGRRRVTQRLGAVAIGSIIALVAFAAPAGASAVYNNTPWTVTIDFSCGWFCGTSWTIPPPGHGQDWDAYPGKAGMYYIQNSDSRDTLYDWCESGADGQIKVPDHGWSQLNATGSQPVQMSWSDYDNNNQLIKTVQVTGENCIPVG